MLTTKTKWQNIMYRFVLVFTPLLILCTPVVAWAAPPIGSDCLNETVQTCTSKLPLIGHINTLVTALSALVGVVVVGVIIMGGIQYSAAGDNPQALTAAKKRITNGLIALLAFALTAAFLQWIVPGGLFS